MADLPGSFFPVGNEPEGIVYDRVTGLIALSTRDPSALVILDGQTGEIRRRVPLAQPARHLSLAGPGGPVLVPSEDANELIEVELPNGSTRATATGTQPHDATSANGKLFVADEFADQISVVEDGRVRTMLEAPKQPGGIVAIDDRLVALITVKERKLSLYDAETLEALDEVDAGAGPTHIVAADDGRVYVADTDGGAVLVFDTEPELEVSGRANASGAPYGIAIDNERDELWVTLTSRNRVNVYSLAGEDPERVRSYATVGQPNTLAIDPDTGTAFIAGRDAGVVQRIRPRAESGS